MKRGQFILACLSPAGRAKFTPVQLQKLFFLIDRSVGDRVQGPFFNFEPYLYGPFDKEIYTEMAALEADGLIVKIPEGRWNSFRLTDQGEALGSDVFSQFPEVVQGTVRSMVKVVQRLSFRQLVSAIYRMYPEMRVNSIFVE
jgi:uncharacterized protein YwgA